ncbi:MAG: L-2-amino-thiazoline-4-carboxylic acid hydrolase [Desulfobacteraceae bacterium]|nr:MAG: L-2-amino-thiazoline-4-carboxylic acid hydrolase [Desulfobacteraceae bacterium]
MKKKAGKNEVVPLSEATKIIRSIARRAALLHICYARGIIDELGEKKGMKLISRIIKNYGKRIGEKVKEEIVMKGLEVIPENFNKNDSYAFADFPALHDRIETVEVEGVRKFRSYGCTFAEVWKDYGEEKLGRLYCYMDPAKYMAYNPRYKLAHTKTVPDGNDFCELEIKPTTEKEREDFFAEDKDWFYIDKS